MLVLLGLYVGYGALCVCAGSDRSQLPVTRVTVKANQLDAKLNTLLFQSQNAEGKPVDVGVMTAETVFKRWDSVKSDWTTDSCHVPTTSGGFRGGKGGGRPHPPWRPSKKFMVYQFRKQ